MRCFDKAIEIDPGFAYAWYNKGYALSSLGRYEEAIECFDKAIEIDQNLELRYMYRRHIRTLLFSFTRILSKTRVVRNAATQMPLKCPLQTFTMPLKYPLGSSRVPLKLC
jgi:tetratricopeptide (TPR) repeat protein